MSLNGWGSLDAFSTSKLCAFFPLQPIKGIFQRYSTFPAFGSFSVWNSNIVHFIDGELDIWMLVEERVCLFLGDRIIIHNWSINGTFFLIFPFFEFCFHHKLKTNQRDVFKVLFNSFFRKTFKKLFHFFFVLIRSSLSSGSSCCTFTLLADQLINSLLEIDLHGVPKIIYFSELIYQANKRNSLNSKIFDE